MIKVTEIAYTGYPVSDIARARAFYEGLLGLRVGPVFEHDGKQWIEYEVGGGTLAISNMSPGQWLPSPDGPATALEVEDFTAAVSALRDARVKFCLEPLDTGVCEMAIIADPDGNSLIIHRRKSAPAGTT